MVLHRLIEGRTDHFALRRALHVGHLFRSLADEDDHQVDLRVVLADTVGNLFQHRRLAGLGRRDDETTLAAANGDDEVDESRGENVGVRLQLHLLVGEDGRQRLIAHARLQHFRTHAVDRLDAQQAVVLLVVLGHAHLAIDHVAGLQADAPNLRVGDVDVILARQIGPGAQEAHCLFVVLDDLQHAAAEVVAARLCVGLHDPEDEILLLHRRITGELHVAADVAQLGQFFAFQFTDVHTLLLFGAVPPRWRSTAAA